MKAARRILPIFGLIVIVSSLHAGPGPYGPSKPHPRNGDSLTIEEIVAGLSEPTTDTIDSIFSLFSNTYTWNLPSDVTVKLWEGYGHRPGSYPLALQVFHNGKCVAAEKLDFPADSKMTSLVAFSHHNAFVLNLTCKHRHNDYESKCAFSVARLGLRIVNGGPVISDDVISRKRQAGQIHEAEPVGADQPTTAPKSKSGGNTNPKPPSDVRPQ